MSRRSRRSSTSSQGKSSKSLVQRTSGLSDDERERESKDKSSAEVSRQRLYDANSNVRQVCSENSLSRATFVRKGDAVSKLEMFFFNLPTMKGAFEGFAGLTELSIVGQEIGAIEGLEQCTQLEQLWICECRGVRDVTPLASLHRLRKLYLYSNTINTLRPLAPLTGLQVLLAYDNQLVSLAGVETMHELCELNVARNRISVVGTAQLAQFPTLASLNLAANRIVSFSSMLALRRFQQLRSLWLSDPMHGDNPVCALSNYLAHTIHLMPALVELDGQDVRGAALRNAVDALAREKDHYYNMRVVVQERECLDLIESERASNEALALVHTQLRLVAEHIKVVQQRLYELSETNQDHDQHTTSRDRITQDELMSSRLRLVEVHSALQKRMAVRHRERAALEQRQCSHEMHLWHRQQLNVERRRLEMRSWGNLVFEEHVLPGSGVPPEWVAMCIRLVQSRCDAEAFQAHSLAGVVIERVTRVRNQLLERRFHAQIRHRMGIRATSSNREAGASSTTTTASHRSREEAAVRRRHEYLFAVEPDLGTTTDRNTWHSEYLRASERGPRTPAAHAKAGLDRSHAIPLTNSVILATYPVGQSGTHDQATGRLRDPDHTPRSALSRLVRPDGLYATLVLVRFFAHNPAYLTTDCPSTLHPRDFPGHEAVTVLQRDPSCAPESHDSNPGGCACRWKHVYHFDSALCLPEFFVDIRFTPSALDTHAESPLHERSLIVERPTPIDEDTTLFALCPIDSHTPRHWRPQPPFAALTRLYLNHCRLTHIPGLDQLPSLVSLAAPFNHLVNVDDICNLPFLKTLDVSFNEIQVLVHTSKTGLRGLAQLECLDISFNQLQDELEVKSLGSVTPLLVELDSRGNHFQSHPDAFAQSLLDKLDRLRSLDGCILSDETREQAMRVRHLGVLTEESLERDRLVGRTTLDLSQPSARRPVPIRRLCDMSMFASTLRRLDLSGNQLWRVDPLAACIHLEHLVLNDNCVTRLGSLARLPHLYAIHASRNRIASLAWLCTPGNHDITRTVPACETSTGATDQELCFESLVCLNVTGNRIRSLEGISGARVLEELYAGRNRIDDVRQVFFAKPLSRTLVMLDLLGNPMCTQMGELDVYRSFVVYSLARVAVLDGVLVTARESQLARQRHGTLVTRDYLDGVLAQQQETSMPSELSLAHAGLRAAQLIAPEPRYSALRSLNLEKNHLSTLGGLVHLESLVVLCLNGNRIETLTGQAQVSRAVPPLPSLKVLFLAHNRITNVAVLRLGQFPALRSVFLSSNAISDLTDAFSGCAQMRHIVLDDNKLRVIDETAFAEMPLLDALHLEHNRLRSLAHLHALSRLTNLHAGMNQIQSLNECEHLARLTALSELTLYGNGVARKQLYRITAAFYGRCLEHLDGSAVSEDERQRADMYFAEHRGEVPPDGRDPFLNLMLARAAEADGRLPPLTPASSTTSASTSSWSRRPITSAVSVGSGVSRRTSMRQMEMEREAQLRVHEQKYKARQQKMAAELDRVRRAKALKKFKM